MTAVQPQRAGLAGGIETVLGWPRLHRWLAALMAGLAVGFLARTARLDRAETARHLATLQAELARSYAALGAAERAATVVASTSVTVMQPVAVAPAPATATEGGGRRASAPSGARNTARRRSAPASSTARAPARAAPSAPVAEDENAAAEREARAVDDVAAARDRDAADGTAEDAEDGTEDTAQELTEADVRAFLDHFRHAFERLNAADLAVLFSEDATDNDHIGRLQIATYYDEIFRSLASARYVMSRLEIRVDGAEAQAVGPVTIAYSDVGGRSWLVDGYAHWWIIQTDDGMAISRVEHRER